MKVITVSRTFPSYHPKAGQLTHFVEKIQNSIGMKTIPAEPQAIREFIDWGYIMSDKLMPKHHTIRSGHRLKTGEMASLRIWSAKPYQSKQITFAEVKVICFDFELKCVEGYSQAIVNTSSQPLSEVAFNDGLEEQDLLDWFKYPKPFTGQIICWNPKITY